MRVPHVAFKAHMMLNRIVFGAANRYERLIQIAKQTRPKTILEIGVWRGERARQLISAALETHHPSQVTYLGFDLFDAMPADMVLVEASRRSKNPTIKEVWDSLGPFQDLGVRVQLVAGNTKETLKHHLVQNIDFAFIDGGHSYETVKNDWCNVERHMTSESVVIFDDYVNDEAVEREGFGVNRLISEIDSDRYEINVVQPVDWHFREWGILKNQLVVLKRKRQP
jgi:predicted O-methyltransferase YrrM